MIYKRAIFSAVLTMFAASIGLGGCGSAKKEGGSPATQLPAGAATIDSQAVALDTSAPPDAVTLAGSIQGVPVTVENTTSCFNCHGASGAFKAVVKTSSLVANPNGWSASRHANQSVGVDASNPLCLSCHDPFSDGVKIAAAQASGSQVPGSATVVGCEACHGGDGMHRGVGPLPAASPGIKRCGACHGKAWDSNANLTFHKTLKETGNEGNAIYDDYLTSPHAHSVNTALGHEQALCSRCHSDEGARLFISVASGTMTASQLTSTLSGKAGISNPSAVQCRTCHDAHAAGAKVLGDRDAALPNTWSAEFKTCTSCHQLLKTDGTQNSDVFHGDESSRIIADTHFSVTPVTDSTPPGYSIDPTGARACSNCHNPHNADNTINKQFAVSNHFVLGESWVEEGSQTNANCQRCHTTTGFINYMGLVAANNNGGTTVTNTQQPLLPPGKEAIYCNACHTDNKGGLRNPKVWQYTNGNSTSYVPPPGRLTAAYVASINSIGGSLLCAHCHMGRTTGQSVKNATYPSGTQTVAQGQTSANSAANGDHYYGTFGWMFRTLAYEYDGVSYDGTPAHASIGTAGSTAPGNGNGPCVGCHMFPDPGKTAANHAFKVINRDTATGRVLSLLPFGSTCSKCHAGGESSLIDDINLVESQYSAAIQAFRSVLASRHNIFYKLGSNPNSSIAGTFKANADGTGTVNWPLTATDPQNKKIGAGFNLRTLDYRLKNRALFHNIVYTKRIIYDSIDFLDDGSLNASVDTTVAGITETAAYVNETASEFQITPADKTLARAFLGATRP